MPGVGNVRYIDCVHWWPHHTWPLLQSNWQSVATGPTVDMDLARQTGPGVTPYHVHLVQIYQRSCFLCCKLTTNINQSVSCERSSLLYCLRTTDNRSYKTSNTLTLQLCTKIYYSSTHNYEKSGSEVYKILGIRFTLNVFKKSDIGIGFLGQGL